MSESPLQQSNASPPDLRMASIQSWLQSVLGSGDYDLQPASADASFRRYFRTEHQGNSLIVMDAPPDKENSEPFVRIAELMQGAGLHAPRVLHKNLEEGFLLLTDMGSQTYMSVLSEANADAMMGDAIDALITWQLSTQQGVLPPYDKKLLEFELSLFPDWYVARHLQAELSVDQRAQWSQVCTQLVDAALAQPQVYVHRDYMPRNLMVCDPNPGILDFQDAVHGPIAYDVLSLFKDAFLSWPATKVEAWRAEYWHKATAAGLPVGSEAEFRRAFDFIGLHRHLKVLGIFARINYRDGKPHYLQDAPRFIRYIREVLPGYPELNGLANLFDDLELVA